MKYWIIPLIIEWSGIIGGAILLFPLLLIAENTVAPDSVMIVALGAVILGLIGATGTVGSDMRIRHHKRILQKAGLWQDEEIKRKDLRK